MIKKEYKGIIQTVIPYIFLFCVGAIWHILFKLYIQSDLKEYFFSHNPSVFLLVDFDNLFFFGWYIMVCGFSLLSIKKQGKYKNISVLLSLLALSVLSISYLFTNFPFALSSNNIKPWLSRINLVPFNGNFQTFLSYFSYPALFNFDNWINILLFIPIGILIWGSKKRAVCVAMSVYLILSVEFLEIITSMGYFDVNDIIYRLFGMGIGTGVAVLVNKTTQPYNA